MTDVTREEAIRFCNEAMRNWSYCSYDEDELEDLRAGLSRHRTQAIATALAAKEAELAAVVAREAKLREALEDLETREAEYRHEHDIYGDGNILTGRAWDRMRRAGDRARTALTSFRAAMGEGQSDA